MHASSSPGWHTTAPTGGTLHHYVYDVWNRLVQVWEDDGEVTEWTPDTTPDWDNEVLFQGRRLDTETGLYYYRRRMYHPTLGRFLQRDPIGYVDGMNLYQFVGGRPAAMLDPFGRQSDGNGDSNGDSDDIDLCPWPNKVDMVDELMFAGNGLANLIYLHTVGSPALTQYGPWYNESPLGLFELIDPVEQVDASGPMDVVIPCAPNQEAIEGMLALPQPESMRILRIQNELTSTTTPPNSTRKARSGQPSTREPAAKDCCWRRREARQGDWVCFCVSETDCHWVEERKTL